MNKKRLLSILTTIAFVAALTVCASATNGGGSSTWYSGIVSFAPMIIIILVFYFVLIRPENKRKKETAKMRDSLAKGDKVTTIGGIVGTITKVKDDEVTIETGSGSDKCKICFTKWAISSVNPKNDASDKKSKNDKEDIKEDVKEDTEE